jgi:molybdopterin-guanine dinucleotide biosynthesis protein A
MINRDNCAVVLAGGKNSRLGRAKALLEFDANRSLR